MAMTAVIVFEARFLRSMLVEKVVDVAERVSSCCCY